ncbi:UDP-glucose/GDP-mannose dehydrogenase family protein [Acidobacteria bacterium ACD]|nr:MAG: UDP-glucose/GDP-mannose dehydrogenase family protein [Acidobacteriota bacterium]MCE7957587.1 UDP-glucose/GDP-mannose dehydrogenase family protein [Acidobacteria bacterium ACB2]MDL1949069.1 UDP-glucose/GDP-mannose dehydrogenase family protein [Acidobacteria bacterium ACD]
MNICMVGTGYVGLVTGACLADFGMDVTCIDNDAAKVEMLRRGVSPIYEPGLEELIHKNEKAGRLHFSMDIKEAIERALVIFIAVGTPPKEDGSPDLSYIFGVATSIAEHMNGYKVVVTKSTVPTGTGKQIEEILRTKNGRFKFSVVSNPEFLREGSAIEDFMRPDRVVIGSRDEEAIAIVKDVYSPLQTAGVPFVVTDVESAELIKYASNGFLSVKISFVNEIAILCERMGADVKDVARGMGLDKRIGPQFLAPGPGFGGSCFPKDSSGVVDLARRNGYAFEIMEAVLDVNQKVKARMVEKVDAVCGGLAGKRVAVLGLAFKPETDDIRESASLKLIEDLQARGASVAAYDPAAMENSRAVLSGVTFADDVYSAVEGADALVLATDWNQFRKLDLDRLERTMKSKTFVDLRNLYEPKEMRRLGWNYVGLGRG